MAEDCLRPETIEALTPNQRMMFHDLLTVEKSETTRIGLAMLAREVAASNRGHHRLISKGLNELNRKRLKGTRMQSFSELLLCDLECQVAFTLSTAAKTVAAEHHQRITVDGKPIGSRDLGEVLYSLLHAAVFGEEG